MEKLQMEKLESFYDGKIIFGIRESESIGKEIVKTLLNFNPKTIRELDINETALFKASQRIAEVLSKIEIAPKNSKIKLHIRG